MALSCPSGGTRRKTITLPESSPVGGCARISLEPACDPVESPDAGVVQDAGASQEDGGVSDGGSECTEISCENDLNSCHCFQQCGEKLFEMRCVAGICVCTEDGLQTGTTASDCSEAANLEAYSQDCGYPRL